MELRHERNVCGADIQAHLREKCGDLTPVVRLVIEHVRDKDPLWAPSVSCHQFCSCRSAAQPARSG